MKKLLLSIITMLPIMGHAQKVWEYDDFTVTKVSNPYNGEREVDGLIAGGDRENSYTWRLAALGDEIYIATARNIASTLVNMYGSQIAAASGTSMDTFWAMIDAVTNGDIMRNDVSEGANIIAFNRRTGEFRVVWTGGPGEYQRMAVTFGDAVYFGSYSADQSIEQYILKLDKDGNFTKVYTTTGTTAMRANCVYDDHLFFASADARTVVAEGDKEPLAKMAVIRKSNDDDTQWDFVADYRDFGNTPYDPIQASWAGAPFWELATHNGYIYATAPSTAGFVAYRGRPAQDGETVNDYGWHWEEVIGPDNGINNPGLSQQVGGEPGTMRSLIGSVYEFQGELYAYNFDHAFGGEAQAFVGMLQQLTAGKGKASDYLSYMYNSLQNPQKVWKLNDETGKFEELTAFTRLMEGTTNEYIWRMGEHNGRLYVATMDAGIFYNYLTQLTNGSFFQMTPAERLTKVAYLNTVIQLLLQAKGSDLANGLRTKLELLKEFLVRYVESKNIDEDTIGELLDLQTLTQDIQTIIATCLNATKDQLASALTTIISQAIVNNKEQSVEFIGKISTLLSQLTDGTLQMELELLKMLIEQASPEDLEALVGNLVQLAMDRVYNKLQSDMASIYDRIDGKGIEMYAYINQAVRAGEWGFDLLRTSDGGETFEVITRTGFDDKYNYGCPSFLSCEEGLYLGTCNPFYGGQLYLLTEPKDEGKSVTGIAEQKASDADADNSCYYTLDGRRIHHPRQKGIYVTGNRVTVIK